MRNFQDTFETRKQSFISVFSICMAAPLMITKVNYCSALDKTNRSRKVYIVPKKIQVLFCLTPVVTRIIQFVDMSISKATLNNFKEVKFRFLVESFKQITGR